jgi:hypothetical protein
MFAKCPPEHYLCASNASAIGGAWLSRRLMWNFTVDSGFGLTRAGVLTAASERVVLGTSDLKDAITS